MIKLRLVQNTYVIIVVIQALIYELKRRVDLRRNVKKDCTILKERVDKHFLCSILLNIFLRILYNK